MIFFKDGVSALPIVYPAVYPRTHAALAQHVSATFGDKTASKD